jgi:hypothetical protein
MMKIIVALFGLLALNACSQVTVNATMCDQIMHDPSHPQIPQECRDYSEKEAEKAFNKVVDEKKVSKKDIEFTRENGE